MKTNLAKLANETLHNILNESSHREKISIGTHNLKCARAGDVFNNRYKNIRTGQFDGIHFYGPTGCRDLTSNLSSIIESELSEFGTAQLPGDSEVYSVPIRNRYSPLNNDMGSF